MYSVQASYSSTMVAPWDKQLAESLCFHLVSHVLADSSSVKIHFTELPLPPANVGKTDKNE